MKKHVIKFFSNLILNDLKEENIFAWLGGGCLRDFFSGEPLNEINDIDIYVTNETDLARLIEFFSDRGGVITFETDTIIEIPYRNFIFELHKFYYPSPEIMVTTTDTTISSAFIDIYGTFVSHEDFFIDLAARRIVFTYLYHFDLTLSRVQKLIKKGFTMDNVQINKLGYKLRLIFEREKLEKQSKSEELTVQLTNTFENE